MYVWGCDPLGVFLAEKYFVPVLGLALGGILIFIVLFGEAFVQLAFAAAMHHRLVPVLAKIFCYIGLVGVEVDHNDSPAECHDQEGQQKQEGYAFL